MTLEELRKRLSEVDRELIGLVAARQKIVAEIGAHKDALTKLAGMQGSLCGQRDEIHGRPESALALLAESYGFIAANWLEWFPANLVAAAIFYAVSSLPDTCVFSIVQYGLTALLV